jgi:hypothetical protein
MTNFWPGDGWSTSDLFFYLVGIALGLPSAIQSADILVAASVPEAAALAGGASADDFDLPQCRSGVLRGRV